MSEININIEVLDEKIVKLQNLKETCEGIRIVEEDVVGSGQSTEIVKDIRDEYKMLKDAMSTLISNSINFFNGVKESAKAADEEAASSLSK